MMLERHKVPPKALQDYTLAWLAGTAILLALILVIWSNYGSHTSLIHHVVDAAMQSMGPLLLFALQVTGLFFLVQYIRRSRAVAEASQANTQSTYEIATAVRTSVELSRAVLGEMEAARAAQAIPYVVVYLERCDGLVRLVMANLGQAIAKDIQLEWTPAPPRALLQGRTWAEFVTGITTALAPSQQLTMYLDTSLDDMTTDSPPAKSMPTQYQVTVRYRGKQGSQYYQGTDVLDLKSIVGVRTRQEMQQQHMHSQSERLLEKLSDVTSALEQQTTLAARLQEQQQAIMARIGSQAIERFTSIATTLADTQQTMQQTKTQLAEGLTVYATTPREGESLTTGEAVVRFKKLVKLLSVQWNLWQQGSASDQALASPLIYRRFRLWIDEITMIIPYLPATTSGIERLGHLSFKLLVTYSAREACPDAPSTGLRASQEMLAELITIANAFPCDEEDFLL